MMSTFCIVFWRAEWGIVSYRIWTPPRKKSPPPHLRSARGSMRIWCHSFERRRSGGVTLFEGLCVCLLLTNRAVTAMNCTGGATICVACVLVPIIWFLQYQVRLSATWNAPLPLQLTTTKMSIASTKMSVSRLKCQKIFGNVGKFCKMTWNVVKSWLSLDTDDIVSYVRSGL